MKNNVFAISYRRVNNCPDGNECNVWRSSFIIEFSVTTIIQLKMTNLQSATRRTILLLLAFLFLKRSTGEFIYSKYSNEVSSKLDILRKLIS